MSRELPILFNTKMVRAILDGRKTVTRRLVMPHNRKKAKEHGYRQGIGLWIDFNTRNLDQEEHIKDYSVSDCWMRKSVYIQKHAPYQTGDILYVRETWQHLYDLDDYDQIIEGTGRYYYAATDAIPFNIYVDPQGVRHDKTPWRPSIHMPKEAARIWLKVTDVRVERLKDIMKDPPGPNNQVVKEGCRYGCDFIAVWENTIKKSDRDIFGWDANPWVWVIEFERCGKPKESDQALPKS